MPKYIVFAGPNGCGKSTLYHTNSSYSELPRINVDEIARENGLDWKNPQHLLKAGKIAVEKLNACFASLMSFNQETTLCGKSILNSKQFVKVISIRKGRETFVSKNPPLWAKDVLAKILK